MQRCKECNDTFEDEDEAKAHVKEQHADKCDEFLQEYVEDSVNDAVEDLIEEV